MLQNIYSYSKQYIVFAFAVAVLMLIGCTAYAATPVPVWVDKETITVNSLTFHKVGGDGNWTFQNQQMYFPNGTSRPSKSCTSSLVFPSDPYADSGGQTANLVLYSLDPEDSAAPTKCVITVKGADVNVSNAKAVNGNQQNGITDTSSGEPIGVGAQTNDPFKPICDPDDKECQDQAMTCATSGSGDCGIFEKYINPFISFLSIIMGVGVTIALVVGGIRYITAGADPGAVSKAKGLIFKAITALIFYILLWAFINWLQVGGLKT